MSDYIKVESIDHLKELADDGQKEFFISFGVARSSKDVEYYPETEEFWVWNGIDDTEQTLTADKLKTESNIAEAIEHGNFYMYNY